MALEKHTANISFLPNEESQGKVLYVLCEKTGALAIVEPGLTAGRQAGR